ncbi:hypothetical protein BD309DRAFT_983271 [Dichomitus squalens]|nr:hypothetical protein BD309DRAFT_983271 [Dichomitus squalens]
MVTRQQNLETIPPACPRRTALRAQLAGCTAHSPALATFPCVVLASPSDKHRTRRVTAPRQQRYTSPSSAASLSRCTETPPDAARRPTALSYTRAETNVFPTYDIENESLLGHPEGVATSSGGGPSLDAATQVLRVSSQRGREQRERYHAAGGPGWVLIRVCAERVAARQGPSSRFIWMWWKQGLCATDEGARLSVVKGQELGANEPRDGRICPSDAAACIPGHPAATQANRSLNLFSTSSCLLSFVRTRDEHSIIRRICAAKPYPFCCAYQHFQGPAPRGGCLENRQRAARDLLRRAKEGTKIAGIEERLRESSPTAWETYPAKKEALVVESRRGAMEGGLTWQGLFVANLSMTVRGTCQSNVRDPLVLRTCPKNRFRDASLVAATEASTCSKGSRACRHRSPSLLRRALPRSTRMAVL